MANNEAILNFSEEHEPYKSEFQSDLSEGVRGKDRSAPFECLASDTIKCLHYGTTVEKTTIPIGHRLFRKGNEFSVCQYMLLFSYLFKLS